TRKSAVFFIKNTALFLVSFNSSFPFGHLFIKLIVYNNKGRIGGEFMEDRELIRQILQGDDLGIEELHHRYVEHLFNFIYAQTNNYHDAEELLQDVFYK